MKRNVTLFSIFVCFLLLASCSFDSPSDDIPSYENLNYNPSIEELKSGGIPIVEISVSDGSIITSRTEYKYASLSILGSFCGEDNLQVNEIQIKGRGNSSWGQPKKPYTIKLAEKEKMLGMKKSKKWVLIANYSDKSLLRNYFASKLGNTIYNTVWNPSFKSVNLIVNGKYQGVYLLGESVKIDKNRVNIKDISETEIDEGGFIFEINQRLDEKFNFKTKKNVCISLKDPDEISSEKQDKVRTVIQNAEDILFSENFNDSEFGYIKYFDVDSVIDWYLMNELGKNVDSANYSSIYFYYNPEDKLLHMGPNWDYDLSCGNANYNGCDSYTGLYVKENSVWIKQMFTDPVFVERVKQRWDETKSEVYNSITVRIQEYSNELSNSAEFNFNKWQVLGHYIWPNCAGYENRTTYQSEVDYLINWLKNRYNYLDSALSNLQTYPR